MFKVNNEKTVFIIIFEHISLFSSATIVDFEQVNVSWDYTQFKTTSEDFSKYPKIHQNASELDDTLYILLILPNKKYFESLY